jgi:hypothetical protein
LPAVGGSGVRILLLWAGAGASKPYSTSFKL